ncbi:MULTISPECIES: SEFIR domain-containing protein [Pseudomonas syringae group]|uniref:TIR domain-containing protein n=1 Tax=Pseudomonas lijiangensis TaxID=2995658 RepID=A0ABX8HVK5_9PSED|nr:MULTISPECIES: TIR domain-containing protein [Pseudomonas syringae group]MBX8500537.1 TIR domain-containing protein [Pseudomonas lijiangensis]MBX8505005.1 TIR domain-containing protein [Pseudomonas lijiangensis]MBX8529430.1 TIR domain-containing protein [Pseudomonas cichorii]QWU84646.1 TIR domain-containing protein [Pseudomonas lijiangensis]
MNPIRIFISYSWDGEDHQSWVQRLANDLDEYKEFHVTFDMFDMDSFSDKNQFMEEAVRDSDVIIVVCTEKYRIKAEARDGGVGIETCLTAIRHWEESEKGSSSNILVVSREKFSTPFYLRGKFRVDFYDDDLYAKSLSFLVKNLSRRSKQSRPEKRKSIEGGVAHYDFTRVEDILKLKYSKRTAIIDSVAGTDRSGNNRIKFELWEVRTPFPSYFLILYPNITITQTINRFCQQLVLKGLDISNLTILRPAKGDDVLIQRILAENKLNIEVADLTYSEFIWEYCIDEGLRISTAVRENKFYTDQALSHLGLEGGKSESANKYLADKLNSDTASSGQLITATGGMGKSTLCHELAISLQKNSAGQSSVILIKAESLRNNFSNEFLGNVEIRSVYDLYDLHSQINKIEYVYDRNQFELCLLCGRVVVIVDGLDEFVSILQDRFNLQLFLSSISEAHQQMGRSQVILTSRNMSFLENTALDEFGIECHELLGFDEASRAKYIRKRFSKYSKSEEVNDLFEKYLSQLEQFGDHAKRIIPFFIDMVSTIFEEQMGRCEQIAFEISSDECDYACNSNLTDLIIYSVLRREKTRHDIELDTRSFIEFFSELAVECGEVIAVEDLKERLSIYYGSQANELYSKIEINPLLVKEGSYLRFRYQFLNDYFKSLFVIDGVLRRSTGSELLKCLASTQVADKQSLSDVVLYFSKQSPNVLHDSVRAMLKDIRTLLGNGKADLRESETIKKAIGALLSIYSKCTTYSRNELSRKIRDLYQVAPDLEVDSKIEYIFIYGDYPSLDFSNLKIWNSGFYNYDNFTASRFFGAKFYYSEFLNTGGNYASETFDSSMFDSTCKLGDLTDTLALIESTTKSNRMLCESELKKFFRSFYKGASFVDQKLMYVQCSVKLEKLSARNFDSFIKMGVLDLAVVKNVDKFYVVSGKYQGSVFKFLNDNFMDEKIRSIINYIME